MTDSLLPELLQVKEYGSGQKDFYISIYQMIPDISQDNTMAGVRYSYVSPVSEVGI